MSGFRSAAAVAKLHRLIGVTRNSRLPEEITVSVAAELIRVRKGRAEY